MFCITLPSQIFVVGRPTTPTKDQIESALKLEADRHEDLLFVDFDDTYLNLSFKSLAILRWAERYCHQADFFFQGDTDAIVFPEYIDSFVANRTDNHSAIYGSCWQLGRVFRDGKW